jgi:sialic acid synthase SpsE
LGAAIIEKHFTLDRSTGGPDSSFSVEPPQLRELCAGARTAWQAMGRVDYGLKSSETGNIKFRRSLYFVEPVRRGERISHSAVRSVRPGYGVPPKKMDLIVGAIAKRDIQPFTPVREDDIS